jgi:hypothetical protein
MAEAKKMDNPCKVDISNLTQFGGYSWIGAVVYTDDYVKVVGGTWKFRRRHARMQNV